MLLGIDHLVIACVDPDAAADELHAHFGLEPGGGGRHERLGTFNRLVWLGDSYLELIGVFDAELAAVSWLGAPTLRALASGGGLATWAVASDGIEEEVGRLRSSGSDLATPIAGERIRPDGRVVRWRLSTPSLLAADKPPFLIEHDPTAAEWTADERTRRAGLGARIDGLELAVDDVDRTVRAFTRTLAVGFRPSLVGGGARQADIGAHRLLLRPRTGRTATGATIALSVQGRPATKLELLGCRWVVGA
jgi:hypothetical protein